MASMTRKELKKLSRAELLELLLAQSREVEHLRQELQEVQEQLRDKQIRIERAGDLATAVLEVNGVFEAAQAAAQQYLSNMADLERNTRIECNRMLAKAKMDAERIRNHAQTGLDLE